MKKIVTGLSMLSMLALAAGCSDDNTWATGAGNTGKATFAITNGTYSLSGTLDIFADDGNGNPGANVVDDAPFDPESEDEALSFSLPPGTYHPVDANFTLFEGGVEVEDATFVGFRTGEEDEDDQFTVAAATTTPVNMVFAIDGEDPVVIITNGSGEFSLLAEAPEEACGVACGGGDLCAVVDGQEAQCVTPCPGGNGDCEPEEVCVVALTEGGASANYCAPPPP